MRGFAPLGRLIVLAMIIAGLGTVTAATVETAHAATSDSPTAVGVSSGGTTYVGFASGGKLQRISASGRLKGGVPLDQDEAVDGLFVAENGDIWVDYETSVSRLSPGGRVLTHFDHRPMRSCDGSAPAHRYGGITANGNRVYVANRCDDTISVYSRTGDLVATVDLPGTGHPRGITYGNPQAGRPAMLYVALPDRAQILSFKAAHLRSSSKPVSRFTLHRPAGGSKPQPGGLAVDKWGQLTATDMANHALYLLDTNHNFSLYRTLGHPPRAGRAAGRLNYPTAIAQHDQDGGALSGDLFIADTNNNRVQRWNTSGYTYWTRSVRAGAGGDGGGGGGGGGGGVPRMTSPPEIGGTPQVGEQLTCFAGSWEGNPSSFERGWTRNGAVIAGARGTTYTVADADDGTRIACRVRATNSHGTSGWASSDPVTIGGSAGGPTNTTPPVITGTPAVGQVLSCSTGTWSGGGGPSGGSITYAFQWRRNGASIPGATSPTYTVVAADNGTAMTCTVTATNAQGTGEATSEAVTIGGGGAGPTNTSPPVITGTPAVGGVLSCSTGTWTGSSGGPTGVISYAFQWQRNGTAIGSATLSSYPVVAADAGKAITCVVTATDDQGSTPATSAPVTIAGGAGPTNTSLPQITGTPAVGQVLSCSTGTWSGSGPISYAFQWQRNGSPVGSGASSYTVVPADAGKSVTCVVTATDDQGSTPATSAPVTIAGGAGPTNTSLPQITGTPAVGQLLSCSTGTWSGSGGGPAGSISYAFQWKRNGTAIAAATSSSYAVASADDGKNITCVVTATNADGSTEATSAPVTIGSGGTAPVNTALPYLTGSANIGEDLTCNPGSWSGSGITYAYQWKRNTSAIPLATWATYTVLSEDAGTTVTCTVTATNGQGSVQAVSSGAGISGPSGHAPANVTAPSISGTPAVGQTLTCDPGTWTGNPELVYGYHWQRNGENIATATSATYAPVALDAGAGLRCVVVVANGYGKGAVASPLVTVTGGGGGTCAGPVGVTINGGDALTTTRDVTLTICPPSGATSVAVSNDSGFANPSTFALAPSHLYSWIMGSIPGSPLSWSVFVRFDNDPTTYWDSIVVSEPAARRAAVTGW